MVRDYGVQTMRVPPWMQGCDMDDICRRGLCITLPAPGVLGGHTFSFFATARTQRHFVPSSEPGPHNLRNVFGLCCFHSERSACVGPPNGEKCLSASLSGAPCSRPSLLPRHAAALSGRTLHPRTTATDYATYLRAKTIANF